MDAGEDRHSICFGRSIDCRPSLSTHYECQIVIPRTSLFLISDHFYHINFLMKIFRIGASQLRVTQHRFLK